MEIKSSYYVDRAGTEGLAAARKASQAGGTSFGTVLAEQAGAAGKTEVDKQAESKARQAAEGLVAHALILPMLKQLRRESLDRKGVFSPGTGEKTFGPEFDMQIADRIARSPRMTVTESLTQRLLKKHLGK